MTNILENLNGVAAIGVGIGLMTVVGQCLGAGRKDEVIYYIKKLSWLAEAAIVISCLTVLALTKPITLLGGMERKVLTCVLKWSSLSRLPNRSPGYYLLSRIRHACSRRCQILHDHLLLHHVALPCEPLCLSLPCLGIWPDCSLDRYVCRLDAPRHRIFDTLPRKEMVKPPHYRLNKRLSDAVIMKEFSFLPSFLISSAEANRYPSVSSSWSLISDSSKSAEKRYTSTK